MTKPEFVAALRSATLRCTWGAPDMQNPQQLKEWYDVFQNINYEDFSKALDFLSRSLKKFPSIAEILEVLNSPNQPKIGKCLIEGPQKTPPKAKWLEEFRELRSKIKRDLEDEQ